jgi:hypothetical protein
MGLGKCNGFYKVKAGLLLELRGNGTNTSSTGEIA